MKEPRSTSTAPTRAATRAAAAASGSPDICTAPVELRLLGTELVVPAFRIEHPTRPIERAAPRVERVVRAYRLPSELRIDLAALEPDRYRVVAVQNFWSEDQSPDLDEALAGVFLARRRADGGWEEAETWPVECRTLALLGYLELRAGCPPELSPP